MVFGIENLGNTCFMSVGLQFIILCAALTLGKQNGHSCRDKHCLTCALEFELDEKKGHKKGTVRPTKIHRILMKLGFGNNQQADPGEALIRMLDELEKTSDGAKTAVHRLLYTKTHTTNTRACGHPTYSNDSLESLMTMTPQPTVHDTLERHFAADFMDGTEKLECDVCNCKVNGQRRTIITGLPTYLPICLKNVQHQQLQDSRSARSKKGKTRAAKINVLKRVDETVDLRKFCSPELQTTYSSIVGRLIYVCVHESSGGTRGGGRSASSGHYYCFVKNDGAWHKANDAKVTQVDEATVLKEKPYILAYKIETVLANGGDALHLPVPASPDVTVAWDAKLPANPAPVPASPSSHDRKQPATKSKARKVHGNWGCPLSRQADKSRSVIQGPGPLDDPAGAPSGAGILGGLPSPSSSPTTGACPTSTSGLLNPWASLFKPAAALFASDKDTPLASPRPSICMEIDQNRAPTPAPAVEIRPLSRGSLILPTNRREPRVHRSDYEVEDGIECTEWSDGRTCFAALPDTPRAPASHFLSSTFFVDSVRQYVGKRGRSEEEDEEGASEGKSKRYRFFAETQSDEWKYGGRLSPMPTAAGETETVTPEFKAPPPTQGTKRTTRDDDDEAEDSQGSGKKFKGCRD